MNQKNDQPYLTEVDGAIDIALAKPISVDGASVSKLRLREPTVADMENAQRATGEDAAALEVTLFSNLLEISVADVRAMKIREYNRVRAAYSRFTD